MQIIVVSPEATDPREVPAMAEFFAQGLERYHVRKPRWDAAELEAWLLALPADWRPRLLLHQHPFLVAKLGLGGRHERDGEAAPGRAAGRSCHDLASLRRHGDRCDTLLFGPVFASLTKPGYAPAADFPWRDLQDFLRGGRPPGAARVLAIGGVTAARLARCAELGFDGAALLGAVWNDPDPARAYAAVRAAAASLEAPPRAA
jgi:thiamine-phosphate pyrophosphorylase